MKIQPYDHTRPGMLMHSPEDGGASPLDAASSPTGAPIEPAGPGPSREATIVDPLSTVPDTKLERGKGVIDVRKAMGLEESPAESLNKLAEKARENAGQSKQTPSRVKKVDKPEATKPAAPAAKEPAKLAATEPAKPAAAKPPKAPVATPTKIKLGDKEFTPDELAAHVKALEEKANPPAPVVSDPTKPAPTAEELAKQERDADLAYISEVATKFNPEDYGIDASEKTYDDILTGGKENYGKFVALLGQIKAAAQFDAQANLAQKLNPIFDRYEQQLAPISEAQRQVQQYQAEAAFATKFPDLADKKDLVRNMAAALIKNYPAEVARMTPDQFNDEIAINCREAYKVLGGLTPQAPAPAAEQPVPAPAAPAPPAEKAKPRPPAPTGILPQSSQPKAQTTAGSIIADLERRNLG